MEIFVERTGYYTELIKLVYTVEDIQEKYNTKLNKISDDIQYPGFRKGKAPKYLLNARFKDAILKEIKSDIVTEELEKTIKEKKIEPFLIEPLDAEDVELGKPYEFAVTMQVKPLIENPVFKGLEIERPNYSPDEHYVDDAIFQIRKNFAFLETVDRPAEEGDYIKANVDGKMQYLLLYPEQIGQNYTQLIGLSKGDKWEGELSFGSLYYNRDFVGKTMNSEVEVLEVRTEKLPDLNIELMKKIIPDAVDETDFRTRLLENFICELDEKSKTELHTNLIVAIAEKNPIVVPPAAVRKEALDFWTNKLKMKEIEFDEPDNAEVVEKINKYQKEIIIFDWIIDAIIEKEAITFEQDDIDKQLADLAKDADTTPDDIRETLEKTNQLDILYADIKRKKAYESIIANAVITDKDIISDYASREE